MDVSCSGFMEVGSKSSLGFRPMAGSMGVLLLEVTLHISHIVALRIN